MAAAYDEFEDACRVCLDHFFGASPDPAMQKRATKVLRLLTAADGPLAGKPEGWAAGIIYAGANRDRRACGIPGLLNSEVEAIFGVSMGTVRKRAAQVAEMLEW